MTAQMTYQSPTLAPAYDELSIDENEVLPAILWGAAPAPHGVFSRWKPFGNGGWLRKKFAYIRRSAGQGAIFSVCGIFGAAVSSHPAIETTTSGRGGSGRCRYPGPCSRGPG